MRPLPKQGSEIDPTIPPGVVTIEHDSDSGILENGGALRRKASPALRVRGGDKTDLLGGLDIFFTFDQPHRCAGRDSGEELRSPIEDRLEIAGLLLDPSPQRRDEHLPKLLVPAELAAGAFFPDNLLDERALGIDVRVCRNRHPFVLNLRACSFGDNRLREGPELASAPARGSLLGRSTS